MRLFYRPHFALDRPSVPYGLVTRKQKTYKNQKWYKRSSGTSKCSANYCQLKRSKVKVTGRQLLPKIAAYLAYMFTYRRRIKRCRLRRPICKPGLIIVIRPYSLSTSETLGNWTDGRISCRRRHLFLFDKQVDRRRWRETDRNLVVVRAVSGFLDARVSLLISDLDTDDGIHVDTCQLPSFNHCH